MAGAAGAVLGEKAAGKQVVMGCTKSRAPQPSPCLSLVRSSKDGESNSLGNSQVQIISEFPGSFSSVQLSKSCAGPREALWCGWVCSPGTCTGYTASHAPGAASPSLSSRPSRAFWGLGQSPGAASAWLGAVVGGGQWAGAHQEQLHQPGDQHPSRPSPAALAPLFAADVFPLTAPLSCYWLGGGGSRILGVQYPSWCYG